MKFERPTLVGRVILVCLLLVAFTPPAAGDVIVEDFNGPVLDLSLWSIFDQPGNGAVIDQTNGRLEFSIIDNLFGWGQAAIYGNSWALDVSGDFLITLDHKLTIGNPGATATGLKISLFSGSPDPALSEDRIDVIIYRWGTLFWTQWALTADGSVVQSGISETDANVGTLQIYYSASGDWLSVQSQGAGDDDPISLALVDIEAWTGATCFQVYLGGFRNGLTSTPVDGPDAWFDDLVVSGPIVDLEQCSAEDEAGCPTDTNLDGGTDMHDIVSVVLDWSTDGAAHNGDVNGSSMVDVDDLLAVVTAWGPCPR